MPKDAKKKIWEKERRDHLKEAFLKLEKLLPSYDPSITASRIEVLTKSIEYIQEMKNLIQEFSKSQSEMNPKVLKFKNLQDRIKRLVSRLEIMNRLLREAKIPIPSARSWKEFKHKNYKWSGKIDEVKDTVIKPILMKKKSTGDKCKSTSDIETGNKFDLLSKHRKSPMNKKRSEHKLLQPSTSKCVIIYTQAYNTSPCYLVSSTLTNNLSGSSQTVSTNSVQASNPSIALNVKESGNSSTPSNSKIQSIGGTLILTNGGIYPILQQPKTILPSSMLLQVNDNSDKNDSNIKQKVRGCNKIDGQKKNLDVNSNKNSINKKSNLKTSNGTVKNSNVQMKPKLSPNILPLGSNINIRKNSYLLPNQMNPIVIPNSSDILRPKVSFSGITKRRAVGKRIGDKPVSRQALKRIGKLARQKELEERKKIEHNPTNSNTLSNNENEISSQKSRSNIEDIEMSSVQEVTKFNDKKNDGSTDNKIIQDLDAQKSISIISDEVIRESSQNIFTMDAEEAPTIIQVSKPNNTNENENMLETKAKEEISIGEVSNEETKLLDNNSDKTEQILKQNSIHLEKSKSPNETEIVPEKQNENDNSKNVESTEKLQSCVNELQNISSLSVSNSEQIIQTENNSDLENVCNVNQQLKNLDIHLGHSELSNDLFASLQVPPGCQNPESTSPTAAFLLAFPLVSSLTGVKVTEVIDEENPDSQRETPTLLQIGTMDTNKSGQSENFNSNLLNLDFFSSKDIYGGFYNSFEHLSGLSMLQTSNINENQKGVEKDTDNSKSSNSYNKSSINVANIQPSHTPKQSMTADTNASAENVPRNTVYSSSNIDCQPRFLFDEKQASSICLYEKDKTQMIPSETYSDKSIEQYSQGKKSQNKNENDPIEDAKKRNDDVGKIHLPQSMNQNFQTKVEFIKDSVSHNKSSSKSENSFLRIESCDNIFNAGGLNNNHSKGCEHVMNFYPEKQKLLMSDHFNTQDMNSKNKNVASLHQENMHNVQMPPMENKNFVPSSINSNQVGSAFNIDINTSFTSKNMNSLTKEVNSFSNTEIQPYFLQDKNYQSISNQVNSKSSNLESKNTETLKYINYGNFISDPKKSLKDNDLNADFNLESKVSPIAKITNAKDITGNFNMGYPNSAYDINNITKIVTCAYNSGKPASDPLYTNSNNHTYNYYSNSDNYISEVCYKTSKIDKPVSEAEIFTNYKRTDYNTFYTDNPKKVVSCSKAENMQDKSTYNWMTTPAKPSNVISNFQKDDIIYSNANLISGNQNNYFNPVSTYTTDFTTTLNQTSKKTFDIPLANINYQKSEIEDGQNQFSWSPTKMPQFLDPVPSFVSSTLPTLVGDLALGSSNLMDQKYEFTNRSSKEMKHKVSSRSSYDSNQSNFLSVSQLVHQNDKNVPGKPSRRRNSGGASKNSQLKNKKLIKSNEDPKAVSQCFNKPLGNQILPKIENKSYNCRQMGNINCEKRNSQKVNSSIYSAEALISQHSHSENSTKKDQKFPGNTMKNVPVPPYIPDNIMPYFPTVDLQQENIMQQNQNYQNFPGFTTFSNNTYSTNNFIPSSSTTPYISSSSFASDVGVVNEVSSENINIFPGTPISKIKLTTKNREEKNDSNNACTNISIKKVKRKPANEIGAASNLVDFSFLSVPGSIHSPILPDDFHTHTTYLPPPPPQPQLYPCKNTFYPAKQSTIASTGSLLPIPPLSSVTRSGLQHPDVSPSLNSVGTSSLTNFNLSTIFPEINKSSMSDIYTGSQSKDQGTNKHFSNSAIPFNAKPPFTYPSCPITQPYEIDNR